MDTETPPTIISDPGQASAAPRFPYQPLDASSNEIRLLHILKSEAPDSPISCTISHFSLDQSPVYVALSYTWCDETGDDSPSQSILLNDHIVGVTQNLSAALLELRKRGPSKALWIDALCIDQANITERNAQVRGMGRVYHDAEGIISWLGPSTDDSQLAFATLRDFVRVGITQSLFPPDDPWSSGKALSDEGERRTRAVIQLFNREYWYRAWVVQEIALSRELVFFCGGGDEMSWEDMMSACDALAGAVFWMTEAFRGSAIFHLSWSLLNAGPWMVYCDRDVPVANADAKGKFWARPSSELCLLLLRHRFKRCRDPLDMVYSILGLALPEDKMHIPVDYTLQPAVLFRKIAALLITAHKQLRILAENKSPSLLGPSLPSWAVNWANPNFADKIRLDRESMSEPRYCASGTLVATASIEEDDGDILHVRGVRLGQLTHAGPVMPDFAAGETFDFAPVFDVIYAWWLLFSATGRAELLGETGFINLLNYGTLYHAESVLHGFPEALERTLSLHLRVVLSLYRPDDETLLPGLGKYPGVADEKLRLEAETNLWSASMASRKRRICVMDGVHCGIGPQCADVGDLVVVVSGVRVPLVLRPRKEEDGGGYVNLGDAYVEGFMYGEAVKDLDDADERFENFAIH